MSSYLSFNSRSERRTLSTNGTRSITIFCFSSTTGVGSGSTTGVGSSTGSSSIATYFPSSTLKYLEMIY